MARCENPLKQISEQSALAAERSVLSIRPCGNSFLIANSIQPARKSFCCNMGDRQIRTVSPIMTFRLNCCNSMKTKDRPPFIPIKNFNICTMIVQSGGSRTGASTPIQDLAFLCALFPFSVPSVLNLCCQFRPPQPCGRTTCPNFHRFVLSSPFAVPLTPAAHPCYPEARDARPASNPRPDQPHSRRPNRRGESAWPPQ